MMLSSAHKRFELKQAETASLPWVFRAIAVVMVRAPGSSETWQFADLFVEAFNVSIGLLVDPLTGMPSDHAALLLIHPVTAAEGNEEMSPAVVRRDARIADHRTGKLGDTVLQRP